MILGLLLPVLFFIRCCVVVASVGGSVESAHVLYSAIVATVAGCAVMSPFRPTALRPIGKSVRSNFILFFT